MDVVHDGLTSGALPNAGIEELVIAQREKVPSVSACEASICGGHRLFIFE